MNLDMASSCKRIGISLLTLLFTVPLSYAQHQEARGAESPRVSESPHETERPSQPSHQPPQSTAPKQPVVVNRANYGSVRHLDTNVVRQPAEAPHGGNQYHHFTPNHAADVDIGHPRFWNGFVFGARHRSLRPGYVQIFVGGSPYFYDDGIYYQQAGDDYQEVYPPVGADVQDLPDGAIEVDAGNIAYYYAGGAFYIQQDGGYVIAPTPIGVAVPELPPGAVQVSYNGGIAYQFNGIYYQPEFVDGVTQYVTFQP